jgi:gas vesicle protein
MDNNRIYYSREAEMHAQRERLVLVMLVTGMSITIGTLIALLFAPQSGDDTRHQLGERAGKLLSKAQHLADEVGTVVRDKTDELRETVND